MRLAAPLGMIGILLVAACSNAQSGRMESYLSPELSGTVASAKSPVRVPAEGLEVGLLIVNDTTGLDSAPSLSAARWAVMETLVRQQLERSLPIRVVAKVPSSAVSAMIDPQQFRELGRGHGIEHVIFAVLSSQDDEGPTHLGQGYMMTQMPGVTVVNRALMELALVDVKAGTLLVRARGRGREVLEKLDVPLGRNLPTKGEARDILRVNAGKHALDRAIVDFRKQFDRIYVRRGGP